MWKPQRQMALSAILTLLLANHSLSQKSEMESNLDLLDTKAEQMLNYARDFLDFAQSNRNDFSEYDKTSAMYTVAKEAHDYLDAASALLFVYSNISSEADRAAVGPFIKKKLSFYAKQLDISISIANNKLSFMKSPAVVASGTRLKDDIREAKKLLETVKLQ